MAKKDEQWSRKHYTENSDGATRTQNKYQKIEESNTNTKQIPKNRRKQHEHETNTKK